MRIARNAIAPAIETLFLSAVRCDHRPDRIGTVWDRRQVRFLEPGRPPEGRQPGPAELRPGFCGFWEAPGEFLRRIEKRKLFRATRRGPAKIFRSPPKKVGGEVKSVSSPPGFLGEEVKDSLSPPGFSEREEKSVTSPPGFFGGEVKNLRSSAGLGADEEKSYGVRRDFSAER